jgi:aspartyl-tRNA(Asn)/glutamyl-tRNA(Gln) amidotransferase subunit A
MTRTVTDAALMLSVIAEPDHRDIFALNTPAPDYRIGLDDGVRGLRIAWSPKLGYVDVLDSEVGAICAAAAQRFADLGAHVEEVDPGFDDPFETIFALWSAGSAAAIAPFSAHDRAMMDPGFVANAQDGEAITAAGFIAAFTGRAALSTRMAEFHTRYDLLLTPTMPIPAFAVGHDAPPDWILGRGAAARRSLAWTVWSPYTYPFNLTMQPAASVPAGLTAKGLPVGLQIVGPMGQDARVLRASRAFESISPFPRAAFP